MTLTRRSFLGRSSAFVAAPFFVRSGLLGEKLRIGVIGVANRGADNIAGIEAEEIAALCDVDSTYLDAAAQRFPGAKEYRDYREMIAAGGIDAVVVSTPDHSHFPASKLALDHGLHVYCEKPLTHTVAQARVLAETARAKKLVTQMGTQIHAGDNYRRVVEKVRSGILGPITSVDVFCAKTWSGGERPTDSPATPPTLDWNLWLGPAAERPYHPDYHPASWRRFWAFGGGTLGDMGCHYIDLAFWALDLRHPDRARGFGPAPHAETTPPHFLAEWDFPAGGSRALPSTLRWHDDGCRPARLKALGLDDWSDGVLFVGTDGWLLSDYDRHVAGPDPLAAKLAGVKPTIPPSIGHHREWIEACKSGGSTTCSFDYSGALTESVLLGNIAYRMQRSLTWNAQELRCEGDDAATALIHESARSGFPTA